MSNFRFTQLRCLFKHLRQRSYQKVLERTYGEPEYDIPTKDNANAVK